MDIGYLFFLVCSLIVMAITSYLLSRKSFYYVLAYILSISFFVYVLCDNRALNCSDIPLRSLIVVSFMSLTSLIYIEKIDPRLSVFMITAICLGFVFAYLYETDSLNNIKILSVSRKCEYDDEGIKLDEDISYVKIINNNDHPVYLSHLYLSDGTYWNDYAFEDIYITDTYKLEMLTNDGIELSKHNPTVITLSLNENSVIDEVEVPGLLKNEEYSVISDSIISLTAVSSYVSTPVPSRNGGYYDDPFYLELNSEEGTSIYYTTDGSDPDENSALYTSPVYIYDRSQEENVYRNIPYVIRDYDNFKAPDKVDKIFVLRAIAIDNDGNRSDIITNSYIISLPEYKDKKVISLVTDPDNLFDPDKGIYVVGREYMEWYENNSNDIENRYTKINYKERGRESERGANIELLCISDCINQNVGIRVRGVYSANQELKRFSVFCRKEYSGSRYLDKPLFDDESIHSFVLRNGKDNAIINRLLESAEYGSTRLFPAELFLNGEYWGDTYVCEKTNEEFLANKYGVNKYNVLLAKNSFIEGYENGYDGDIVLEIRDFLANNEISLDESYRKLNEIIDVSSYIRFNAVNVYLANHDYHEHWNTMLWRTAVPDNSEYGDGRWRWIIYDMDLFRKEVAKDNGLVRTAELDSFTMCKVDHEERIVLYQPIFSYLMWNDTFRKDFVNTFMDLVNTVFEPSNVEKVLKEFGEDLSYDDYFYRDRASYITGYLEKYFELNGSQETVSIHIRGDSRVKVNSIIVDDGFVGKYYTDYPIVVSCDNDSFDYWLINGEVIKEHSVSVDVSPGGTDISLFIK